MSERVQRDVPVRLGSRAYSVRVGRGLLGDVGPLVSSVIGGLDRAGASLVVTNPVVGGLYARTVVDSLKAAGACEVRTCEIADGERHKTLATVERVYDAALSGGLDRTSIVVALGGGVVGDVAGFAAATLLRGLRVVMIPTTLLAQVDSSVGGKTGVNRAQGKNLVGVFHQPSLVVADPDTLATLPVREYRAGLAEVVKYGVILDAELFELLESRTERLAARDVDVLTDVVARCAAIKASVVERDETEGGLRRVLNFGHTIGHAIEQATDYDRFLHGEAVAMGMIAAARLSERIGACDAQVERRLARLLAAIGLEREIPRDVPRDRLERAVAHDKKAERERVAFIVCSGIGAFRAERLTPAEIVAGL
jgi:3-dehydroquinate synthase